MFKRRGNRIKPLLDIKADWVTGNQYPDYLHVAMSNGRVIPYVIDARPIRIHTGKDGWEKTGTQVIGYRNLTDEQKVYALGKMYEAKKHTKRKPQKRVTSLPLRNLKEKV